MKLLVYIGVIFMYGIVIVGGYFYLTDGDNIIQQIIGGLSILLGFWLIYYTLIQYPRNKR